jgi:type I restriction enzyme S subunit
MKSIYETTLPEGWIEAPLARLVVTRRGYTWEKADEVDSPRAGTVPVIRIPNVQDTLDLTDLVHLRNVSPEALQKAAVTKDWLLFVGSNGTQDRIGDSILIEEDRPMVFASFLMGIQPKDQNQLRSDFFAYWMRLHLVHEVFSKTSQQTTGLANFSWSAVKKLPLRYPSSTDEQAGIARSIGLANMALQRALEEERAATELRSALLRSALFDVPEVNGHVPFKYSALPAGWTLHRIGRIVKYRQLGTSEVSDPGGSHTPILKMADLSFGELSLANVEYVDEYKASALSDFYLVDRDFLFNTRNTPELVGKAAVWKSERERCIFNNNILRMRFDESVVIPEFMNLEFACWRGRRRLRALATGTTSVAAIYWQDLARVWIALPDLDTQRAVVAQAEVARQAQQCAKAKVTALTELRRSLLKSMLTGEISVPEGVLHA